MCYDERLYRSWATKRLQKRDKKEPVTGQDRPREMPVSPAPETKRRNELERELEEIV